MKFNTFIHKIIKVTLFTLLIIIGTSRVAYCSDKSFSNLDDIKQYIYNEMLDRNNVIRFSYTGDKSEFVKNINNVIEESYNTDSYTERSWLQISPFAEVKKNGNIDTTISVEYLTTKDQEEYIDKKATEIVNSIITDNMTDVEKVNKINQYCCQHMTYDFKFNGMSAYSALTSGETVCQGYSMSAYKLCEKAGIKCEIVVGSVNGGSHSWNKVFVNGKWSYLDITNNDATNSTRYLLVPETVLISDGYIWNR